MALLAITVTAFELRGICCVALAPVGALRMRCITATGPTRQIFILASIPMLVAMLASELTAELTADSTAELTVDLTPELTAELAQPAWAQTLRR